MLKHTFNLSLFFHTNTHSVLRKERLSKSFIYIYMSHDRNHTEKGLNNCFLRSSHCHQNPVMCRITPSVPNFLVSFSFQILNQIRTGINFHSFLFFIYLFLIKNEKFNYWTNGQWFYWKITNFKSVNSKMLNDNRDSSLINKHASCTKHSIHSSNVSFFIRYLIMWFQIKKIASTK